MMIIRIQTSVPLDFSDDCSEFDRKGDDILTKPVNRDALVLPTDTEDPLEVVKLGVYMNIYLCWLTLVSWILK